MQDEKYDNDLFRSLPQAEDLRKYIDNGIPTNHFLTALLSNDLMACFGRADLRSRAALADYVTWLKSYAPGNAYGSASCVAEWIARGGLAGREKE